MAPRVVKIAVTIPRDIFKALEDIRRTLKVSRSSLIDQAVKNWIDGRQKADLIRRYEEGYRKNPETRETIQAMEKAQIETFTPEDWS